MAGALDGVRVLDFTVFQQGPQATVVMADMGADVIKVEPPMFGDLGRVLAMHGEQRLSAYHLAHSRGKRSITVNLKTDEGRAIVRRLVPAADVFVHNFRPGAMERLELGYEEVRALNERIIYAHASGWGAAGPKANHPAFDIAAQAQSGLMAMTGEQDGGPLPAGVAIADYAGAMNLALAVIAALYARERTGAGQKVETSLFGSAVAAQAWELQYYILSRRERRSGRGHAYLPTIWRTFRTQDGWAVVGGVGDDRWPAFCAAVGMRELQHDARFANAGARKDHLEELYELLDDKFLARTTAEWIAELEAHDMICAPVATYEDVTADPQALANEYLLTVDHPSNGPTQVVGFPWKFSETPARVAAGAPELGQHTEEILLSLGYGWDEIAAMRDAGAI
ncbi:MAG TPA: CoA transferase [Dehalococcoidia bacterium]|nr:CoA transferase [Dehalococcoidia bacterium]